MSRAARSPNPIVTLVLATIVMATVALAVVFALRWSARDADDATDDNTLLIQRAALTALFTTRERAQRLLLWSDATHESSTLQLLRGEHPDTPAASRPDPAALSLPIPVSPVKLRDLERHFAEHADGWESWFLKYPASSGIVALTVPVLMPATPGGNDRAALVVARTCGEHCHSAWRVELEQSGGAWIVVRVRPLSLPRD